MKIFLISLRVIPLRINFDNDEIAPITHDIYD